MPVKIVSQKFSHPKWGRIFKGLWHRPIKTADFGSSFLQIHNVSNVSLVGRYGSRLRYVLVHNFLRKQCDGSKKWRWLIQWDELRSSSSTRGISMPNFEVLDARIASALNKIIHKSHFKRRISLEEEKPKKRTVSFAADRLLTWSTSTSGSLELMIPLRITLTYLQLFFEIMTFRNSIQKETELYCQGRKSHLMTSWKDCTN